MSFKKNTAVTGFTFGLVSATDGSNVTTGTTSGFTTLDGGTQTAIAGTPIHEGNGQWSVNLTAGEMNGDIVGLAFTNTAAITTHFTISTTTKLVSELNDFDPAADTVASVTTVATTTTNTDMRGTDNAQLAANAVILPVIPSNWITAAGIAAAAMNGKGDWNIGKTGYSVTTNLDKAGYSIAGTKTTLDALNDIPATDVVSAGAITTLAGAVVNVDLVDTTTTNTDMRGTDGANTVVPDAAGVVPALLNDIAITKNQAGIFHFEMVLDTDGRTPATGLTVTGQRLIDSGVYVNVAGTITEVSNGTYRFDYLAADSNGDMITWKFSAATADDTKVTFLTVA